MDVATPLEQRYSQHQGQTLPGSPQQQQQPQPAGQEQQLYSTTLRHQPANSVDSQQPPLVSTAHSPPTSYERPKLLYQHISNLPTNGIDPHPSSNVSTPSKPISSAPTTQNVDSNRMSSSRSQQPPESPSANPSSHMNGTPTSIPRLRPSGIPRLHNFSLPSSASLELSSAGVRSNGHHVSSTPPPGSVGPVQTNSQPDSGPISPLSARPPAGYIQPETSLSRPQLGHMDLANHDPGRTQHQQYSARSRAGVRSATSAGSRGNRAISEHPNRHGDTESDTSSVFSSSGTPRVITSKINSLKNVHHKPGGGNVAIVNEKVQLGPIKSKCNSLANVKHKPGGGNVKIVDDKIDLSTARSRINSLQNAKHIPAGGNVQIVSHKLEFDKTAKSKVGSLQNAHHRPGGGDVQIYNETLPWLKYNKPNLPPEEKARINKQLSGSQSGGAGGMNNSIHSGSTRS